MTSVAPVPVSPPNTQIAPSAAAAAAYRTGTGSRATTRNRRPAAASTRGSGRAPPAPPTRYRTGPAVTLAAPPSTAAAARIAAGPAVTARPAPVTAWLAPVAGSSQVAGLAGVPAAVIPPTISSPDPADTATAWLTAAGSWYGAGITWSAIAGCPEAGAPRCPPPVRPAPRAPPGAVHAVSSSEHAAAAAVAQIRSRRHAAGSGPGPHLPRLPVTEPRNHHNDPPVGVVTTSAA